MGDFHGKKGFDRGGFKRPSFGGPKRFGGKPGFRPNDRGDRGEMFDAICADCGTKFQLPFRPAEGRPVYCRDCFPKHAPEKDRDFRERAPRFREERSFAPRAERSAPAAYDPALVKQLEGVNAKLDRLISLFEREERRANVHEAVVAAVATKEPAKRAKKTAKTAKKK